jgi:hypothetical protein
MTIQASSTKPVFTGFTWGIIGGIVLFLSTLATTNGYFVFIPYFLIVSAAIVTTKYQKACTFKYLFITGFICFTMMSLIVYVFILATQANEMELSIFDHSWRIASMIGFGVITSLIISFIANPKR